MRSLCFLTLLILAVATGPARAGDDEAPVLAEARSVASSVPPKLLAVLQQEIARGGFDGAIGACRDFAPELAAQASAASGWQVRRVSLRNRNPKAVPDAWERAVLEDFDRRTAAGEPPSTLEHGAAVTAAGQREYRYMKALPVQELCLACHGTPERIDPKVRAKLDELYPDDRATGYLAGQVRGALTLRRPL